MNPHWTYAALHLGAFSFPFLLSFDKKVAFYRHWKFLFPAIFLVAAFFIAWDCWFTSMGVWGFNRDYVLGGYFFNLPWEEVLFFFSIPYACLFIYVCLEAYFPKLTLEKPHRAVSVFFLFVTAALAILNYDKAYTFSSAGLAALLLAFVVFVQKAAWMGRFWISYAVVLVPFFICNGILTSKPVVVYDDLENLGIRMYTIPVEDLMYNLVMLLGVTAIFEKLRGK